MVWAYNENDRLWYKGIVLSKFKDTYTVYLPTRRKSIQTKKIWGE
jgi:hypothetical protein